MLSTNYKKTLGYTGESIAKQWYIENGYIIKEQNYTIRGGELDIIAENDSTLVFVEVKTIKELDSLHDYITQKKLYFLQKTIQNYLLQHPLKNKDTRIDIVFVQDNHIIEHYQNISL